MDAIKVLIVSDDVMVADIHRAFTDAVPGFEVAKVVNTGREAFTYLESHVVDLIVLDLYHLDLHALDFLKTLRKNEDPTDFILITEAHDSRMIEESMRFGIFDYIIRPFDVGRYKESLSVYKARRESLDSAVVSNQPGQAPGGQGLADVGMVQIKGINPDTMRKIRDVISSLGSDFGIDQVSAALSISRITAHRYLESLVATGFLRKEFRYQKVGRPTAVYSLPTGTLGFGHGN